jgi:putative ABC transport system substrate-binding protein
MMRRRAFLPLALTLIAAPYGAKAQPAKVPRVGFLWTSTPEPKYLEAFRSGLRDLAYVEGRNILVEHRSAANIVQRLDGLASALVASDVDVVVTQGTPAARAVAKATSTIPVVIALGEPIGARLVTSLSHPERNVTGLTVLSTELNAKRLELLRAINPKVSRLALVFDPTTTDPDGAPLVDPQQVETAARSLGMQVQALPVRGPDDFAKAFMAASQARAEALLVTPSPVLSFHNRPLVDLAAKHRLPAIYGNPEAVQLGGLMSYGPSYASLFRRAAAYVDKILKGAKPGDLPIEQPTTFELLINLKTAKALGLTIPPALLARADRVIE